MAKAKKNNNGGGIGRVSGTVTGGGPTARHDWFIIDDETLLNPIIKDKVFCPVINGEVKGHGLVKRDFATYPDAMFNSMPSTIQIIPRSEWSARVKEQNEQQSSLWHIRMRKGPNGGPIPSLDQNGQGYCWNYSNTSANMLVRAKMNLPYVRLSGHAGACMIKNFRDQGGWCGLGAQFARAKGCPSVEFWPEKSMSRANDNPKTWENALLHLLSDDYADLAKSAYDQNLTADQAATCLLNNQPVTMDWNEWSHSVCGIRMVEVESGSIQREIWNSWTDSFGTQGCSVIRASWDLDGAIGYVSISASAT